MAGSPGRAASGSNQSVESREKLSSSVIATILDQPKSFPGILQIARLSLLEQSSQVVAVLRPLAIIARQELQGDKVANPGDRYAKSGDDVQLHRGSGDFWLDPGGGKEKVHNDSSLSFAGGPETHSRQATRKLLFQNDKNLIAQSLQTKNERLGVLITSDRDSEIDVSCCSGLSPCANSQATNKSPGPLKLPKVFCNLAKSIFDGVHERRGQATG